MTEQLITHETHTLAKEKGFKIKTCRCGGFPMCICDLELPTQSLLQKWLREVHCIDVISYPSFMGVNLNYYYVIIKDRDFNNPIQQESLGMTYEAALEAGLLEALKLIP